MVDYFAADADHIISPDLAQRAVGVRVSAADANGYDVGDQVTVTLSSLDFSRDEPARRHGHRLVRHDGARIGDRRPRLHGQLRRDRNTPATPDVHDPCRSHGLTRFTISTPTGTKSSFTIPVD